MHNSYNEITGNVDTSNDENESTLCWTEYISQTVYVIDLEINTKNVIDDQTHKQKSIEGEYIAYIMGAFRPLRAK